MVARRNATNIRIWSEFIMIRSISGPRDMDIHYNRLYTLNDHIDILQPPVFSVICHWRPLLSFRGSLRRQVISTHDIDYAE